MAKVYAAALAAAMLVGGTVASQAAVTKSPTALDLSFTGAGRTGTTANGGYDFVAFTLPIANNYKFNANVGTSTALKFSVFNFYSAPAATAANLIETGLVYTDAVSKKSAGYLDTVDFKTAGTYYIGIKSNATGSQSYSGTLSPVPLPNSVALFGLALAGLGVAGVARRKKSAAAA